MNYVDALTGYVGVGTTAPAAPLHVQANTSNVGVVIDQVGAGGILDVRDAGVSKVFVDGAGNVGIGTTAPTSKLVVDGSTSIGYPTTAAPTNGLIVSGNVGIGVANPLAKLHVLDKSDSTILVDGDSGSGIEGSVLSTILFKGKWYSSSTSRVTQGAVRCVKTSGDGNFGGGIQLCTVYGGETVSPVLSATHLGYVGIGNTNPQYPLDVGAYAISPSFTSSFFVFNGTTTYINTYTGAWYIGIKSVHSIWTTEYFVSSSDTRIKTNIQDIDDGVALSQLRLLQPKTYEYIDKVQRGSDPVIGFIAQEVAEVIPRAVTKQKEIIPSIYAIASVNDGILQLEKEHGLVVGDKVKLIKEQGGELVTTVKEVVSAMSFTIEDTLEDARIFVYGKEVPDFHTLDKNAIFTIGVAAVQELDRQVQQLKADNANILARLTALEQRLA